MEKSEIKKSMKLNGKSLYFVLVEGSWWMPIKPLCAALGVDYNRQFQNIQEDPILGKKIALKRVIAADGKRRKMNCLPEFFVSGWIFGVRSKSPTLNAYKIKQYKVLYDMFNGAIRPKRPENNN